MKINDLNLVNTHFVNKLCTIRLILKSLCTHSISLMNVFSFLPSSVSLLLTQKSPSTNKIESFNLKSHERKSSFLTLKLTLIKIWSRVSLPDLIQRSKDSMWIGRRDRPNCTCILSQTQKYVNSNSDQTRPDQTSNICICIPHNFHLWLLHIFPHVLAFLYKPVNGKLWTTCLFSSI